MLEWIEYDVDVMERDYKRGYSDATACRGFLEQLTEHFLEMESLDLSGMDEMQAHSPSFAEEDGGPFCFQLLVCADYGPKPRTQSGEGIGIHLRKLWSGSSSSARSISSASSSSSRGA